MSVQDKQCVQEFTVRSNKSTSERSVLTIKIEWRNTCSKHSREFSPFDQTNAWINERTLRINSIKSDVLSEKVFPRKYKHCTVTNYWSQIKLTLIAQLVQQNWQTQTARKEVNQSGIKVQKAKQIAGIFTALSNKSKFKSTSDRLTQTVNSPWSLKVEESFHCKERNRINRMKA